MKIYKSNKDTIKWFQKINWLKLIVYAAISFGLVFLVMNLLAVFKDQINVFRLSLVVAILVGIEVALNDLLENRDTIFFVKGNTVSYIEIHGDKNGKVFSYYDYMKIIEENNEKNIFENIEKFEGIDKGKIINATSVKVKSNKTIVKALVKEKEWTDIGKLRRMELVLKDVEKNKKIVIMNDYNDYDELIDKIKKTML